MNPIKRTARLISNSLREISTNFLAFSQWLGQLVRSPFEDVSRALSHRDAAGNDAVKSRKHLLMLPVTICFALFSLVLRILMSPLDLIAGLIQGNRKTVLWSCAGLAVLSVVAIGTFNGSLFGTGSVSAREIELRKLAANSFQNQSFELAATQFDELITIGNAYDSEKLSCAISHARIGNTEKSTEIMKSLAPGPGGTPGYAAAHQAMAVSIVEKIRTEQIRNASVLNTLRWHLSCSGNDVPTEIHRVWYEYYLATNNLAEATSHLKSAANSNPAYLLLLADIYRKQGNEFERIETLKRAATAYAKLVDGDASNVDHRISYSRILFDLERYDLAESVLLNGIEIANEPALRSACAGFYVSLYGQKPNNGNTTDETFSREAFDLLQKSLSYDANHLPTYQALIRLYRVTDDAKGKSNITAMLREILEDDESTALAHFSLSNIYWVDGNFTESQLHMEQAFKANSRFSVVGNNLAWILAHSDPPELDRAFALASQVVENNPDDGRFRDTLATILMKQEQFPVALAEFQKALPTASNRKEIHQKMADIYQKLDRAELAAHHQEQADAK